MPRLFCSEETKLTGNEDRALRFRRLRRVARAQCQAIRKGGTTEVGSSRALLRAAAQHSARRWPGAHGGGSGPTNLPPAPQWRPWVQPDSPSSQAVSPLDLPQESTARPATPGGHGASASSFSPAQPLQLVHSDRQGGDRR